MFEFPLAVIPVLDLKGGLVVRGIGGRRTEYRPLVSPLVADSRPETLAVGLAALGFRQLYLADLDAIAGAAPAWAVYDSLLAAGLELWVDAGVGDIDRARRLAEFGVGGLGPAPRIIIGLETLPSLDRLDELYRALDAERLAFSLDLLDGRPLGNCHGAAPLAIVERAVAAGARRVIVLDLARVGAGAGPGPLELLRTIRQRWPNLYLISGGGVRSRGDLAALAAAGCAAALVASALHDRTLIDHRG